VYILQITASRQPAYFPILFMRCRWHTVISKSRLLNLQLFPMLIYEALEAFDSTRSRCGLSHYASPWRITALSEITERLTCSR
jgi:hypothetical protein